MGINIDARVVYIPEGERNARGRDVVTRPATPLDNPSEIDTWVADTESHPTATIYRLARFPNVTVYYWHRRGTFTAKWAKDGVSAAVDANWWDDAMQAAYAYGGWNITIESE